MFKFILTLLILITFVNVINGGRKGQGRIVGGSIIDVRKVPYIVTIQSWYFEEHNCGGTIIDAKWILTAAHCTEEGNKKYYVRVGSTLHADGGHIFNVTEVINHPKFDRKTMDYDISLLKLDGNITLSKGGQIIELPVQDEPVRTGQLVRVSGWGWTQNDNESRDKLRTIQIDIIDHKKCIEQYKAMYNVTENMICAGRPGKDACQKDSGGPMTINEKKLIGIVSWGDKCADENHPGVYTKVSAFRNWIRQQTGI